MAVTKEKSLIKRFFLSKTYIFVAFLILGFISMAYGRAYYQNHKIKEEIRRLKAETERLESKKIEIVKMLQYVQSPAYIEEKARTEFNLSKEGENVLIVPQTENSEDIRQSSENMLKSKSLSNPKQWWNYFFNKNN